MTGYFSQIVMFQEGFEAGIRCEQFRVRFAQWSLQLKPAPVGVRMAMSGHYGIKGITASVSAQPKPLLP